MKTRNLKQFGKKAAVLGLSSLLFIACGQENKTDSGNSGNYDYNNHNNPYNPPNYGGGHTGAPGQISADIEYLKQNYPCPNGQRLPDIHMSVTQGSSSNTTVYGNFSSGHISGTHSASFAGANYGTRDLIFVTKVSQGGQVAFNFSLSLCPQYNQYSGAEIIGPNTQFYSMEMIQGFNLDHDVSCALGNVDAGGIRFTTNTHNNAHQRLFSKVCSR